MFFDKKVKCIYCGNKMKEAPVCPECHREQKPMVSIERLAFSPIPAENLAALRAKKPGFLEKKIHAEILEAASEGRLRIAEAVSDGIFREEETDDDNHVTVHNRQLIRTPDGSPIEGKFYEGLNFHVVGRKEIYEALMGEVGEDATAVEASDENLTDEPEDSDLAEGFDDPDYEPFEASEIDNFLLHVVRYENKKGKLHYTLINAADMPRLGEVLCKVEIPLYQFGEYEPNRFR